mmetsp:Transcript_38788/g.76881  ORF Transcript_38788/g.76881 Transcript_38788/m.76881 type:complete len:285 (+) Transcript_38788:577-1431(+)
MPNRFSAVVRLSEIGHSSSSPQLGLLHSAFLQPRVSLTGALSCFVPQVGLLQAVLADPAAAPSMMCFGLSPSLQLSSFAKLATDCPNRNSRGTLPCSADCIAAPLSFSSLAIASACSMSAGEAASALLSTSASASSICSAKRTLSLSAPVRSCLGLTSTAWKSAANAGVSTTVTTRAICAGAGFSRPSSTPLAAFGSATPDSSTMMASSGPTAAALGMAAVAAGPGIWQSSTMLWRKSSAAVQHTQPFASWICFASAVFAALSRTSESMLTEAISLTMTPKRIP